MCHVLSQADPWTHEHMELDNPRPISHNGHNSWRSWRSWPKEWANSNSVTQQISVLSQTGPIAQAKQFIADTLAGDYDRERISTLIDEKIKANKPFSCKQMQKSEQKTSKACDLLQNISQSATLLRIMMFSFSTCPFCLRAKQILEEDYGEKIEVYECDLEADPWLQKSFQVT